MKTFDRSPLVWALMLAVPLSAAACGGQEEPATSADAPGTTGTLAPPTGSVTASPGATTPATDVRVRDVELGRAIGADGRITDETDDFRPTDTIYASVQTEGAASSVELTARWTFEDGQVVDESTQTIAPSGPAVTEFHIANPSGWPAGDYRVEILVNGAVVESEDFEVDAR